jgi:diguanylate cyclase (GGDEF)-like protein
VADLTPDDLPGDSTHGGIKAPQKGVAAAGSRLDRDQTLADRDQTLADADQTGSDSDQTAADSDQAAADSDQEASDRDLVQGGDPVEHDVTRDLRDRSAQQRRQTAHARVETASARDQVAHDRDRAASARDQAAALHDRELTVQEAGPSANGHQAKGTEIQLRAEENRKRAAGDRVAAADDRARAAADRAQAAVDREQSAGDREHAHADREALLHQLAIAETDVLTGARTRGPGLADLDHEIDRARRTTGPLVVAYVDVVDLKAVNDAQGHAAGDTLLQRAATAIRGQLRSYDLIVRLGGDEFLCVMSGATTDDAHRRLAAVQAALAAEPDPCEIKVGFATLAPADSAADLIQRADAEMLTGHRR